MADLNLKVNSFSEVDDNFIKDLKNDKEHNIILSTTKKILEMDRKNQQIIRTIKNVKMIFKMKNGGIRIYIGNLGCSFTQPFGAEFFVRKVVDETTDFEDIKGVKASVRFPSMPMESNITSIEGMNNFLDKLNKNQNFEFNIGQFDDFMKIFEFYQKLSNEINNNQTYSVNYKSNSYYFISADVKEFDYEFKQDVKDINGVLIGYKFDTTGYSYLPNDIRQQVRELIDIHITGNYDQLAKIKRAGFDNIYLSNRFKISSDNDIKELKQFIIVNMIIDKKEIVLSGELKSSADYENEYRFLNIYDMGQKIKIESIDNSLRLINQGATGAAAELLEYLIGDKKMPNKKRKDDISSVIKEKYMVGLNESQRKAFLMAIDGNSVSLIKGPPGTGKTHVINAIIQYITKELHEKVIISSQTHIAIDNVLDKLMSNYDLVIPNRITNRRNKYSNEEIDKTLYFTWARKFESHNERSTSINMQKAMLDTMSHFNGEKKFKFSEENNNSDYSVIGATTTTSAIAGKKGLEVLKGYDWLIIDEVSKCPITEVLRYLPYVSKIIMVGDDFQLAPLLEFKKDDVKQCESYDEEEFEKLQSIYEQSVFAKVMNKAIDSNRLVLLNENYRSLEQVLRCYNVFYSGKLIGKREEINPSKVHFEENSIYEKSDVIFVEVKGGQETTDGTSRFNIQEINATADVLKDLMNKSINPSMITVSAIFPYAAQISHFQKNNIKLINDAKKLFKSFEIDTVDAFQGKETDVVLVNTVVTDSSKSNFLNDFRRINVSMSRSRDKLIVFGNKIVLSKIKMKISNGVERQYFKEIIDYISTVGNTIYYEGGEIKYGNNRQNYSELA